MADRSRMASLVYHAGALGDFITTLPALRVWRRLHPTERIILLGKPRFASVAGRFAPWDEIWDVESARFAALFRPASATSPRLSEPEREPGELSFLSSALLFSPPSSPLRTNLRARGVRHILWQAPFPSSAMPIIDYHLSIFPALEIPEEERIPLVDKGEAPERSPSGDRGSSADRRPPRLPPVAIHPGSGNLSKNWPLERFKELAVELQRKGERVVWITGPAEEDVSLDPRDEVWRDLPLAILCANLSRSRLYVGNDSGITHLAAAAGAPTLALFCASDPRIWTPRGGLVRTLHGAEPSSIPLSAVLRDSRLLLGG